jgi:multiple sugar transport system permease protein
MIRALSPRFDRSLRAGLRRVLLSIFVVAVFAFILLPFYWALKSSFETDMEILAIPPTWLPSQLDFSAYIQAFKTIPFARYMGNSVFVSLLTTIVCTVLASMAGYVLARYSFPGVTLILALLLFTQLVPAITRIFPIYFLLLDLKLLNTYQGAVIAYVSFSLPYATLLLQGFFRSSYPLELEEAALIDGCNWLTAFLRIIIPISVPGIIAIGTYSFLAAWNDFLWASMIMNKSEMKTIQVGLRDFIGEMGLLSVNSFMAACIMTAIPAIILFRLAQQSIVQGLTAGAVKG